MITIHLITRNERLPSSEDRLSTKKENRRYSIIRYPENDLSPSECVTEGIHIVDRQIKRKKDLYLFTSSVTIVEWVEIEAARKKFVHIIYYIQSRPDWLEKVSREEYQKLYADIEQNAMDEWYRLEDEKSQLT